MNVSESGWSPQKRRGHLVARHCQSVCNRRVAGRDNETRCKSEKTVRLTLTPPAVQVKCCFTSTEIIQTIRDREPRTSISTFTQLLNSESLSFLKFSVALRPQRPYGLLGAGRGAQDVHLDFHTQLLSSDSLTVQGQCCFTSTETIRTIQ